MPLRLVELTVPGASGAELAGAFNGKAPGDVPIVHAWTADTAAGDGRAGIVVDACHVEALSDALTDEYGERDGFRLTILAVEATVPPIEEDERKDEEKGDAPENGRISREELYEDLAQGGRLTWIYVVLVALSTLVAGVGLLRGDVAVIIGAMVIAPLLGPNIALAFACALGDLVLAKRSLLAAAVGATVALGIAALMGAIFGVDPTAAQIAARTQANLGDIVLALAAGAAGTLAFTSGVSSVVVGVMVAVALLPPLATAGLLLGGGHVESAARAVLLAATNVTCINLAAIGTFFVQRVRPRNFWEEDRAKRARLFAAALWIVLLALFALLMLLAPPRPV